MSGALARFVLPEPPPTGELILAVQASLRLLELGPLSVVAPLFGATYLAPLCELLGGDRPDFVPWFHGPAGAFKSEAAALAQAHFGRFSRQTLPASFTDTANAVERILFSAKDVLTVVDDYHPAQDRREEQTMATNASRLSARRRERQWTPADARGHLAAARPSAAGAGDRHGNRGIPSKPNMSRS